MGGEQAERLEATLVDTGRQAAEGLSTAEGEGGLAVPSRKEPWLLYWIWGELAHARRAHREGVHLTHKLCLGGGRRGRAHRVEQAMQVLLPRLCSHHSHWGLHGPQWFFLRQTEMGQLRGMLGNCPACFWPRDQERVLNQELTAVS